MTDAGQGRGLLRRRHLASLLAAAGLVRQAAAPAVAAPAWQPGRNVELIVGTNPGTGFDRTARVLQSVWSTAHLVTPPVIVIDKPGGAGVIAFRFAEQRERFVDAMSVIGPLLLTNNLTRLTTFSANDLTPLCILLGEEIVVAVPGDGPIKSGRDFAAALKSNPAAVSIGLSGIGGQNHVVVGLIARAAGADLGQLKVVNFEGSGEAVSAAAGAHVAAVVGPASSMGAMLATGRLRAIGVAAPARMPSAPAIPTWTEQGLDVVFSNWRGMAGPKSMPPEAVAWWDAIYARTTTQPDWQHELTQGGLTSQYLNSHATQDFLTKQTAQLTPVLRELKLAPA